MNTTNVPAAADISTAEPNQYTNPPLSYCQSIQKLFPNITFYFITAFPDWLCDQRFLPLNGQQRLRLGENSPDCGTG
jgi:hypothetical protein